ncbi:hypothetical protein HA50_22535 [Pantoea cypripedii]|uniref:Uncharacterized protein n=1 Tax=Pantoea cypripedii TaxID=55209 RepID=A0A1X1EKF5_PANCY|nr:hypothetical protein [Pantoea cypripedii]ORM89420.1 hypothetical protein HA50_22535 [Pantoea cypripedii]
MVPIWYRYGVIRGKPLLFLNDLSMNIGSEHEPGFICNKSILCRQHPYIAIYLLTLQSCITYLDGRRSESHLKVQLFRLFYHIIAIILALWLKKQLHYFLIQTSCLPISVRGLSLLVCDVN